MRPHVAVYSVNQASWCKAFRFPLVFPYPPFYTSRSSQTCIWAWCQELGKDKLLFHRKGPLVTLATDLIAFCYVCEFNRCVTVSYSGSDPPFCLPHEITIFLVDNIVYAVLELLYRGRRRVDLAVLSLFFFSLRQNELLI